LSPDEDPAGRRKPFEPVSAGFGGIAFAAAVVSNGMAVAPFRPLASVKEFFAGT
jgi:hypothetical protein